MWLRRFGIRTRSLQISGDGPQALALIVTLCVVCMCLCPAGSRRINSSVLQSGERRSHGEETAESSPVGAGGRARRYARQSSRGTHSFHLFLIDLLSDSSYFLWVKTVCITKEPKCKCTETDFSSKLCFTSLNFFYKHEPQPLLNTLLFKCRVRTGLPVIIYIHLSHKMKAGFTP